MLERIYLLFEIVAILLFLWVLHGSKKRPGICTIVFVCLELIIASMIAEGWISAKYIVFAYLGTMVVDMYEFNDTLKSAIIYTIVDCIIMYVIQVLGVVVYSLFFHSDNTNPLESIIICFVLLIIMSFIFMKCNISNFFLAFLELNYIVDIIIVILGILLLVVLKRETVKASTDWDFVVFLMIFSLIIFLVGAKLIKERVQKNKYMDQLHQYEQYNLVYKELIQDIRHRQHDFDNHLQAIYSMSLSCNSIEELRREQKQYFDNLYEENYTNYLLKENISSVLTAFLYIKIKEIEKMGIRVEYQFATDKLEKMIPFSDIVELVGNLLDNAVEATKKNEEGKITFCINEKNNQVQFVISNPYNWVEGENFGKYMVDGKSTKGNKRGYGLTNINSIIERYHGLMQVKFDYDEKIKIIRFEIVIPF